MKNISVSVEVSLCGEMEIWCREGICLIAVVKLIVRWLNLLSDKLWWYQYTTGNDMSAVFFLMFELSITASYGDHRGEGSFGTPLLWQWQHSCLMSQGQSILLGDMDLQAK